MKIDSPVYKALLEKHSARMHEATGHKLTREELHGVLTVWADLMSDLVDGISAEGGGSR